MQVPRGEGSEDCRAQVGFLEEGALELRLEGRRAWKGRGTQAGSPS